MPVQFLQPQFAWILAGLAIPIAMHLFVRWRSRQIDLGTLRFLRVAVAEDSRHQRIKRWLLLMLRGGSIALLAGLFARPYLAARDHSDQRKLIAVLIDRSASMELKDEGRRLVDLAVDSVRTLLRQMDQAADVEVVYFDQGVDPVRIPVTEAGQRRIPPAELADMIESPGKLSAATDYGAAMTWVRDLFANHPQAAKELHVYTDLQRSGLDWTNAIPLPAGIDFHLVDLGRLSVHNVAVASAQPAKTVVRPGESVTIQGGVYNAGSFSEEKIPIILTLASGPHRHVVRERISPAPESTAFIEFQVPALSEGLWQGTVQIETDDDLFFDNQRHVAIRCMPRTQVLIIDGSFHEAGQLSEAFYLNKSLGLALDGMSFEDSPFQPELVSLRDGEPLPDLQKRKIVVLSNVKELNSAAAASLAKFVSSGGRLLVFCGEQVHADGYRHAAERGLCVGDIRSVLRTRDLPHRLDRWEESHPLFEPFRDPQHGDLRLWTFSACTRIRPEADTRTIAWFRDDIPALIEKTLGSGKILWFTSSCGRDWSEWPHSRLYLPFMHQMVGYLGGLAGGGPVRDVVLDSALEPLSGPGVFERDGFADVVNLGPRESETDRCTPAEFANRFQLTLEKEGGMTRASASAAVTPDALEARDDEIWPRIALMLFAFLLIEGFVANRTTA